MLKKIFNSERYRYLAKNSFLFSISIFGSRILAFLLVPLYTNVLSRTDYGSVDLVLTTCGLLLFIIPMCIEAAVLRFSMEEKEKSGQFLNFGLRLLTKNCLIFSIILFVFAWYNPINWSYNYYIFLWLNLTISSFSSLIQAYLQGIDKVKEYACLGIVITLTTVISNIFFLLVVRLGVVGYMLSILFGALSGLLYGLYCCGNIIKIIKGDLCSKKIQINMIKFSIPLILNGVAWWVNSSIDRFFVVSMIGTAENGIYAVASKIPAIMSTFNTIFLQAWSLSAIKELNAEDHEAFYRNVYIGYNMALVVVCSIMILLNKSIAHFLFAKDFFIAWKCSSWLLISVLFYSMAGFVSCVFGAVKDNRMLAISTVISGFVNIFLNWLLIPKYKAVGAAIATVCSFAMVFAIRYVGTCRYINWNNSKVKDCIIYGMLVIQVIFEENIFIQVLSLSCILFLCSDVFIRFGRKICSKMHLIY